MNIDERAVVATEGLREASSPVDLDVMLRELKQTRARRAGARVVTVLLVVVLGALGWSVLKTPGAADVQPVGPSRGHGNGVIVFNGGRGSVPSDVVPGLPTAALDSDLSWSPDGAALAYQAHRQLRIFSLNTQRTRVVASCHRCGFAWSPRGDLMAVAAGKHLRMVQLDTGAVAVLDTAGLSSIGQPTWAPTGDRLAFVAQNLGGPPGLYAVDSDGSDLALVWSSDTLEPFGVWDPAWSPDGTTIAFIDSTEGNAESLRHSTRLHISTIAPDGTGASRLSDIGSCICLGFQPGLTWSPDGTTLAVNAIFTRQGNLYEIDADGTHLRLVAAGSEGPIGWQPLPRK
ncbi:MAG: TolB protein [Actinomycetota bacterium]|jgi:Tol biopolymer transport system component|nr:TolB protein [Actinomycetota bacterium]